ncbi:hypothetical protein VMCG_07459 [Cytospora schulzeri]|uniref:Uncharacterized protein n=1 Tax=Cytospora schulzeri TaxID=448051 RepID=A0A423W1D3_9PEZI|nr:hypothetical protein VMCG_07459 [Valsa malicola]
MGRTNQEIWKQPPVSLNVEWPTDRFKKPGPTLEEQKARMRETRAKVANAIVASGHPAPNWPEVGQPVDWSSTRHTSPGKGLANMTSGFGGQTSSPSSSRIPLRYQTSTPVPNIRTPMRLGPGIIKPTTSSLQCSPLSPFPTRPRSKSHQSDDTCRFINLMRFSGPPHHHPKPQPVGPSMASRTQNGLPDGIDPSIFNPRVFVVELPDPVFRRTPPIAPRAMLEQMQTMSAPRQSGRARMDSGATATTSHRSYETAPTRARGYSSTTMGSQQSFEPTGNDFTGPEESFKTALTHITPQTPPSAAQDCSSAAMNTDTHQGLDVPESESDNDFNIARNIPPPPGFEPHHASEPAKIIPPPPGFETSFADFDEATATWSYSKIWVSEEERLRINFARMQEKAYHSSLDKSPFLPQTASEYAALLAEKKAAEAKRIRKRIQHSEEHRHDEVEMETAMSAVHKFELQLFWGRKINDGLSSVLAMETCFNEIPDTPGDERVDWPPSSEFRSWKASRPPPGTRWRSDSHRGAWPFPRINTPFKPDETFDDGKIPYSKRKMVFAPRWDWAPRLVKTRDEEAHMPVAEISITWLFNVNPILADFIREIRRGLPQEPSDD